MNITIKDVTHQAWVSVAAVSRASYSTGLVHNGTRQKILNVAEDLQCTANASARRLTRRKTNTIGLLLPNLQGEFCSEVIRDADQTTDVGGLGRT